MPRCQCEFRIDPGRDGVQQPSAQADEAREQGAGKPPPLSGMGSVLAQYHALGIIVPD